jgi:hypothetical protein
VPPYKLRRRVDHDVRPVRERVDEVGRGHGVVHDKRDAGLVCDRAAASMSRFSSCGWPTVSAYRAFVLSFIRHAEAPEPVASVHELNVYPELGSE